VRRVRKNYIRAYDGWLTNYRVNRRIEDSEATSRLDVKEGVNLRLRDKGLLKVNSVFIEYVDQHFFSRGWAAMGGVPIAGVLLYFSLLFAFTASGPLANGKPPSQAMLVAVWTAVFVLTSGFLGVIFLLLRKDFFCYTHYPVRFNRHNRKIYVFKHNGPDGVQELNWDEGFWFVGYNDADRDYDIRCHVVDSDGIIRHTFGVARSSETETEALQHWEMIRRYMEEPLSTLPFPPLRLYLTTTPTWRNCFIIQVGSMGGISKYMLLSLPWAFFRWISQKTCRHPNWPDWVEVDCQIPPEDPFRLSEPVIAGESIPCDEESLLKEREYQYQAIAEATAMEARTSRMRD
jgi:hypothetical protein